MDTTPTKTIGQGKEAVTKLCRYFTTNRQAFLAPGVKEAHIRQSLIDPLFEALGWDVGNKAMTAPQYREVIPEDSLDVEGQQKAPDYTFRVGSLPKFYAEAKKCGVNIGADPAPAFQLRRYGWSAKLALSILTDFEELAVYDCTMRPAPVRRRATRAFSISTSRNILTAGASYGTCFRAKPYGRAHLTNMLRQSESEEPLK
jgi:predicted type IV restriction endonuclease